MDKKELLSKPMQIESAETDPSASAGNCYYIIRLLSVNVRSKCHWDII